MGTPLGQKCPPPRHLHGVGMKEGCRLVPPVSAGAAHAFPPVWRLLPEYPVVAGKVPCCPQPWWAGRLGNYTASLLVPLLLVVPLGAPTHTLLSPTHSTYSLTGEALEEEEKEVRVWGEGWGLLLSS